MGSGSAAMRALLVGCGESFVVHIISLRFRLSRGDLLSVASFRERHTRPSEAPRLAALILLLRWSSTVCLASFVQLGQRQWRKQQ
jgi:hypothetical protein